MVNTTTPLSSEHRSLLGLTHTRLPTCGKIRAGIKILTRQAAGQPQAQALYDQGVSQGLSFDEIERSIQAVLPEFKHPLVPHNVPWFSVRQQDFATPEFANQILERYGEDRGDGRHLYRFPIIFPSDHWQTVIPHELAAWSAREKRFWSRYSDDGLIRHCYCHAPPAVDAQGNIRQRTFGGRRVMLRADNGGVCDPDVCPQYQQRHCNLNGRFLFFIPGIPSTNVFELHTSSFYAIQQALRTLETISFLRGGRISGFLDQARTPFYLCKQLIDVTFQDERGQPVRAPQWIIQLQAPVDITALIPSPTVPPRGSEAELTPSVNVIETTATPLQELAQVVAPEEQPSDPTPEQVIVRAVSYGVEAERYACYADRRWGSGWRLNPSTVGIARVALRFYACYADRRWGSGWRLNPRGRQRAWDELERYQTDPPGFFDKVETELSHGTSRRG